MSGPLMASPDAVRLSRVVERLEGARLVVSAPAEERWLAGITDDSRKARPGVLFCAWYGTVQDGHDFVPAAALAGAAAAIVERAVEGLALPQVVVRDGRRAAAIAAEVLFGEPSSRLELVGVTGTNGKTTTVGLLRHLLETRHPAASIGTLGVLRPDGSWLEDGEPLTTPGPVELARTFRRLVDAGAGAVAMEVSSHALDQGRVHALRFDAAVFTNLTRDHLDYHGSEEAYLAAKRKLVGLLRPGGVAVINAADPAWAGLAEEAPRALRYAVQDGDAVAAEIRATGIDLGAAGARFRLVTPEGEYPVELPLLGGFNVENALGAAAACIGLGYPAAQVAERLGSAPQVSGRLEKIADTPCPVLRDYAHTPDALQRVLSTLRPLVAGRLIVVFGAGGDRDRGKRPVMGSIAERLADVVIVTSDNPRTEDPEAIIDEITTGMSRGDYRRVSDRRAAIARALELGQAGDLILLAGKGHETYQVLGTEKVPFDERRIVGELLAGPGAEVRP